MMEWTSAAAARLRIAAKGHKQEEVAASAGVSKATYQRILAGKLDPGFSRLSRICKVLGEQPATILGGMDPSAEQTISIPISDIQVSAGPGRFALDEVEEVGTWPFPADWIDRHFGKAAGLRMVQVSGDSQEPELRDGDSVLVDLSASSLREGMHVVRLDERLLIKRIQLEGGRVRLKSANTSYDDIVVDLASDQERFSVVARAVWTGKLL